MTESISQQTKRFSVVEVIGGFSALSIVLGFVFLTGYCWILDWRLLRFMTAQDLVWAAANYVFVFAVLAVGYNRLDYSDHEARTSLFRALLQLFATEPKPLTREQVDNHQLVKRIALWTLTLPAFAAVYFVADLFFKWDLLPKLLTIALFVASSLPFTIITYFHSIVLERTAADRRFVAVKGGITVGTIMVFVYGLFMGAVVGDARSNDIAVHMKDGRQIESVLVYRFSSGVAFRYIGATSVHYIPESEIADLELLGKS
jgi:hypothetical protein